MNRYNYIPSGNTYRVYDMIAKTDNEYIVNFNINNIQYLYTHLSAVEEWIDNLPSIDDLSGYYTKEQIDNLFLNYYTKDEIDNLLTSYYTKDETTAQIEDALSLYYTSAETDLLLSDIDTKIDTNTANIATNTANILTNTTDIANNTASIGTINSIINANFESYGRYSITKGSLDDVAGEVRFPINELIPLNTAYINVILTPENTFTNLKDGKLTFNIIENGIVNDSDTDLTISLRLYKNDVLLDKEDKIVETSTTTTINYAGTFETTANDFVYATLQITNGVGTLTAINDVIINIDFNSSDAVSAVKSSGIINDSDQFPNNGINPILLNTNTNTANITTNTTNINKINNKTLLVNNSSGYSLGETITLSENYRNYQFLNYRVGLNTYRILDTIPSLRMNLNDNVIITRNVNTIVWITFITSTTFVFNGINVPSSDTYRFFVLEGVDKVV